MARRMIYPLTPKEMDRIEIEETRREEEFKGCYIKKCFPEDYRNYCSISICARELE